MQEDSGGRRLHQPSLVFGSHFAALHGSVFDFDPMMGVGAGDETRTRDIQLGRMTHNSELRLPGLGL
jgi:hypothetical protein